MAVLPIFEYPDSVLKQKARPVPEINDTLQKLIDDMFETMYAAPGIGLAAPQVGLSIRLFVYDLRESEEHPRHIGVLINPEFVKKSGAQTDEEGCLSVMDYRSRVERAKQVVVRGLDRRGQPVTVEGAGLMARMLQHEMDHLDGMVFVDRLSSLKRQMFLKRLKKRQRTGPGE